MSKLALIVFACGTAFAADPILSIAVNTTTIESAPLFVAASMRGSDALFRLVPVTNGRLAMAQLTGGSVDAATGSETQLLLNSVAQPGLRVIFTLAECRYRVVARGSAGIRRIADLRGKKVGVTPGTSSLYFLTQMLRRAKVKEAEVSVVSLEGPAMPMALRSHEVDAIAIWEPHAQNSIEVLAGDAVVLEDADAYTERFNLNATEAVLRNPEKRRAMVELLRLLIVAAERVRQHPQETRKSTAPTLNTSEAAMTKVWPQFRFPGDLRPGLLNALQQVEPWAASSQNRQPQGLPVLTGLIDASLAAEARRAKKR